MYALTADRRDSRSQTGTLDMAGHRDRLAAAHPECYRPWQVSAGDELQVLFARSEPTVEAALSLAETGRWHVGVGLGALDEPVPATVAEATGEALQSARVAVEAAKKAPSHAAIRSPRRAAASARDADALLALLASVRQRRTPPAREATALADQGLTQEQIARLLEIDQSSVSRRLRSALWHQESDARRLLVELFARAHRLGLDAGASDAQHPDPQYPADGGSR